MRARESVLCSVTLDGGRAVAVRTWPGRGHPLVLLHGLLDSSAGWDDLARASHRPCFAIDLPGFGSSSLPTRPRLDAYAEDIAAVLDRLGVRSCTLVGHSLGGGVATAVAERVPERIAGLVLSAPAGFGPLALVEFASLPVVHELAVAALPRILTNQRLVNAVYRLFVTTATGPGPAEELKNRLAADGRRAGPGLDAALRALAAAIRSRSAFYRRAVVYSGPTWVLWGDRDALVPLAHARGVLAALPQARLHVWRDMGHHPQRERPQELSALVEEAAAGRERGVTVLAA
jgi:pimeloyl-ACP methyl ester carboxylesterase